MSHLIDKLKQPLENIKWIKDNSRIKLTLIPQVNRPIKPGRVTSLAKAVRDMGIIRPVVVAKLSFMSHDSYTYAIIDGQHLFHVLLRLGSQIPYCIIDINDEKELVENIASLNNTSRSWTFGDYIHAWSFIKNSYKTLESYNSTYDFDYKTIAAYLSNQSSVSGSVSRMIKEGRFVIREEDKNKSLLDDLTECLTVIPRDNYWKTRYVCSEYLTFRRSASNYNHVKFMEGLEKTDDLYTFVHHEDQKLSDFFQEL